MTICDTLRHMAPFAQFKKREKSPWRSATFSKVARVLKVTLLHGFFSRLFKLYKWYQIAQSITLLKTIKS